MDTTQNNKANTNLNSPEAESNANGNDIYKKIRKIRINEFKKHLK